MRQTEIKVSGSTPVLIKFKHKVTDLPNIRITCSRKSCQKNKKMSSLAKVHFKSVLKRLGFRLTRAYNGLRDLSAQDEHPRDPEANSEEILALQHCHVTEV